MSFDFVDFLAIVSCFVAVVISYKMVKDIISVRKQLAHAPINNPSSDEESEYTRILEATYWLEHERQRNQGEHYEDESVYLSRAQTIRTNTCFFSFVNE